MSTDQSQPTVAPEDEVSNKEEQLGPVQTILRGGFACIFMSVFCGLLSVLEGWDHFGNRFRICLGLGLVNAVGLGVMIALAEFTSWICRPFRCPPTLQFLICMSLYILVILAVVMIAVSVSPPKNRVKSVQDFLEKYEEDKLKEAIARLPKLTHLNPDCPGAVHYNRGIDSVKEGNLEGAIANFTEAIRLKTNIAEAYCCRGDAYVLKRDLGGAIADFTEAILVNPDCALAYYYRGMAYEAKGNQDKKKQDFDKVMELVVHYKRR